MIQGYAIPNATMLGNNGAYKSEFYKALEGAKAAGATVEDAPCLLARGVNAYNAGLPATPSLLIVPQFYKDGNLYQDVPPFVAEDSTMRFTVSRNTTATRVNSSGLIESVASGVPRIDWLGQSCPALLVEASATNGILNSTDTTTSWSLGANLTSGAIDVIGVTGNNITVAVSGSSIGNSAGRLGRSGNNVALASGSTYTISFFIKKTGAHTIGGYYAIITGAASGNLGAGFDVSGSFSSGSIFNTAGTTNRIRRVEQWGTDVYRCSETFTMTASGTLTSFFLAPLNLVNDQPNPAVGTQLGFAAPQIELGASPTSFIPTTTAAGSRAADVISASGALVSGLIGQTEGTIYAEVDVSNITALKAIIQLDNGTGDNRLLIQLSSLNTLTFFTTNAGSVVTIASGTITTGTHKISASYSSANVQIYMDGLFLASGTMANYPSLPLSNVSIGSRVFSGVQGNFLNDRIRAAALYTTRLSNDQLAELTRL
jgi:hypothetical protein